VKRLVLSMIVSLLLAGPAHAGQQPPEHKNVRGYSLVLLMGDTQGSSMPEGLSAQAQKALTDLKDFLPYKSYRLLDTKWLAGADAGASAEGRLRGAAENEYFPFSAGFSQYNQKFEMWAPDGHAVLLNGTFTMHVGETVVVGTSRVQGDKALVVLLTIVEAADVFAPGNGVASPTALKTTKPVYTQAAARAHIEGIVRVQCTVLPDGACTDITVVKSLDENGLDQQAVESVKAWQFKPGMKDGKPVPVRVTVDVEFSLKK
jgi:TonB family protein